MYSRQFVLRQAGAARCFVQGSSTRAQLPRNPILRLRAQQRYQSSSSGSGPKSDRIVVGALTGSLATVTIGYLWYRYSGARELVAASKQAQSYAQKAKQTIQEGAPEPNEALDWLRSTALGYAALIPGAKGYVKTVFDDIDHVRDQHGEAVDKIVKEAYEELKQVGSEGGMDFETAQKTWSVFLKHMGRITDLAGDAVGDILDKHPDLKDKVGGNFNQLKELGDKYGPDAKKEVDKTWQQIKDVVQTGTNPENIDKIKKIVQEKVEKLKKLGDEAYNKALEQAKPYLDKNPKVKELIEKNQDALKQGNPQELLQQVKEAVEKSDTGDLEKYVKKAKETVEQSGVGSLDKYLKMVPGGDQIIPQLKKLQDVAQEHGKEAEELMKKTVDEITQILKKRGDEAKKIAEQAKEKSK